MMLAERRGTIRGKRVGAGAIERSHAKNHVQEEGRAEVDESPPDHFVEHDGDGPEIRLEIDVAQVQQALRRRIGHALELIEGAAPVRELFGDTEVDRLHIAIALHQHVARFQIAVWTTGG